MKLPAGHELIRKELKYARLRVSEDGSVRVLVPFTFTDDDVGALLKKKARWIERGRQFFRQKSRIELHRNQLLLYGNRYAYFYEPTARQVRLDHAHRTIQAQRNLLDPTTQEQWYKQVARRHLVARNEELAKPESPARYLVTPGAEPLPLPPWLRHNSGAYLSACAANRPAKLSSGASPPRRTFAAHRGVRQRIRPPLLLLCFGFFRFSGCLPSVAYSSVPPLPRPRPIHCAPARPCPVWPKKTWATCCAGCFRASTTASPTRRA